MSKGGYVAGGFGFWELVFLGLWIGFLVVVVVALVLMVRTQMRIADAVERMADRRDPGVGPGPTVEGG